MTWYYYARLSLGFFLCCEISGPLCQRVGVACEGCVHCWEEDLMKPVRGWFWSKRWRCQSLGGAGDENNFSFFCQKFNNNPKFISGRYYLLRYVAPPERRSCDRQPTDYQIMVVKMITSHPSRVADHLPEQLIAMTWEKVIISTWQRGQWRYSNWNS